MQVPAVNRALQLARTEAISPLNVTPYTVLLIEANKGWRTRCEELEYKLAIASRALNRAESKAELRSSSSREEAQDLNAALDSLR